MLKEVVDHINNQLETLNVYDKLHGLCEIITDGERTFPAEFCEGQYESAIEFTKYQGLGYHRLDGDITIAQDNENNSSGCGVYSKKTYPMRSVFCVKKRANAYSDEVLMSDIESVISSQNIKAVADTLGMEVVSIEVNGAITDRNKLYKDEQDGDNKVGFEYAYFAVLYDVIIEGDLSCYTISTC